MTLLGLVRRNVRHFWPTNLAVVAGVGVAVAVLAGALLVGASVRASLRGLALERLGAVDAVVTSATFVSESFSVDLWSAPGVADHYAGVVPIVAVEGFVTHQPSGRRASAVQVYGVDERFWAFHGAAPGQLELGDREAFLSSGLARELEAEPEDTLLVRVERPSAVPISSLHGRRDDVGRTLRLDVARVLAPDEQGEFSFRPQQGLARSVFVPLERLQDELDQQDRVNTVLLGVTSDPGPPPGDRLAVAESAVRHVSTLADIGLRIRELPEHGAFALESAAGLIDDATTTAAERVASSLGLEMRPVMTYLANEIRLDERTVPYSLVTGIDLGVVTKEAVPADELSGPVAVVLNEWAADDLGAGVGDELRLAYYVWEEEGRLVTHQTDLRVADVVPIEGPTADPALAPDYPGITEATDVTSWDPPFEFDLGLIRPQDEDYWDEYRTTPKAFLALDTARRLWDSRWGSLTSIRLLPEGDLSENAAPLPARAGRGPRPARRGVGRLSGPRPGPRGFTGGHGLRALLRLLQLLPRGLGVVARQSLLPSRSRAASGADRPAPGHRVPPVGPVEAVYHRGRRPVAGREPGGDRRRRRVRGGDHVGACGRGGSTRWARRGSRCTSRRHGSWPEHSGGCSPRWPPSGGPCVR